MPHVEFSMPDWTLSEPEKKIKRSWLALKPLPSFSLLAIFILSGLKSCLLSRSFREEGQWLAHTMFVTIHDRHSGINLPHQHKKVNGIIIVKCSAQYVIAVLNPVIFINIKSQFTLNMANKLSQVKHSRETCSGKGEIPLYCWSVNQPITIMEKSSKYLQNVPATSANWAL